MAEAMQVYTKNNPPPMEFFENRDSGLDIKCLNHAYQKSQVRNVVYYLNKRQGFST